MAEEVLMTREALEKQKEELEYLKTFKRQEIAERIERARAFGDLSENSEYDEAKSEQAKLEAEINDIETMLSRATIIDEETVNSEVVHLGSVVTIKSTVRGSAEKTYTITGFAQANPTEGKISDESPVGKALLGHKVGDKVEVEAPRGIMTYKITKLHNEKV